MAAHYVLQEIHSLSELPWVYSIPLTALLVRAVIATPLQILNLSATKKIMEINPLLHAWRHTCRHKVLKEAARVRAILPPAVAEGLVRQNLKKKQKELYKRWRIIKSVRYLPILQLPVFLAFIEDLRRMCGMEGLLSHLDKWYKGSEMASQEGAVSASPAEITSIDDAAIGPAHPNASLAESQPLIPIEQSFSTEGALWFPDLLAADPTWTLPLVLSAVVFTSVSIGSKAPLKATSGELAGLALARYRFAASLRFTLQLLALSLGPIMIQTGAPAGLMIYWISSSLFATVSSYFITTKVIVLKPPVTPCRPKRVGMR